LIRAVARETPELCATVSPTVNGRRMTKIYDGIRQWRSLVVQSNMMKQSVNAAR